MSETVLTNSLPHYVAPQTVQTRKQDEHVEKVALKVKEVEVIRDSVVQLGFLRPVYDCRGRNR